MDNQFTRFSDSCIFWVKANNGKMAKRGKRTFIIAEIYFIKLVSWSFKKRLMS